MGVTIRRRVFVRRPVWIAALVLALVAGVVAAVALVGPAVLGPGLATSASAPPQGVTGSWSRLRPGPAPAGPALEGGKVAWHNGVVIDQEGPAVWFSKEGHEWARVPTAEQAFACADIERLVVGPSGFVAIGSMNWSSGQLGAAPGSASSTPICPGSEIHPYAVWLSGDGLSWRRIDPGWPFTNDEIVNVAAGPRGVVATGRRSIWYSTDGSTWREAPLSVPAGNWSAAAGPEGFVVTGYVGTAPVGQPAAWWSPDGLAWTAAAVDGASDACFGGPFIGRDGMIATDDCAGPGWSSSDGRSWHQLEKTAAFPFDRIRALASDGVRIVGRSADSTHFVQSFDGLHWQPLDLVGGEESSGLDPDNYARNLDIRAMAPTGLLVAWDSYPSHYPLRFWAGLP